MKSVSFGARSILVCTVLSVAASGGAAETGATNSKPVVEQVLDILRSSGQIDDQQYDALLRQARDEAAALAASSEAGQSALARVEKSEQERVRVETGYDGLTVESADEAFRFKVGGRIQTDWAVYHQDDTPLGDGIEIRRARLKAEGFMWEDWHYKLEANFETNGNADITDAFISYEGFENTRVAIGHQKVPFSQQSQTSSNWQVFQERALPDAFIDSSETGRRRLGLTAGRYGNHWTGTVGIFGEGIDDTGQFDENWGTAGRFVYSPIAEKDRVLAMGASVYYRDFRRNNSVRFQSRPETHESGVRLVDTGALASPDDLLLVNAEITAVLGPFHAQAEYTGTNVFRRNSLDDLYLQGWYVQAGYFLTGESRNYDAKWGKYKRIVPNSNFRRNGDGEHGWGAWEIAARYSEIDLQSEDVRGGKERDMTLGLNWWTNPSFMFRLNYVLGFTDPNTQLLGARDETVHVIQGRAQVVF